MKIIKKVMKLTGKQFEDLTSALMGAFLDETDLEQMLRTRMDVELSQWAGGGQPLDKIVSRVIRRAEVEGRIDELINQASRYRPGSELLRDFANEFPSTRDLRTEHIRPLIPIRLRRLSPYWAPALVVLALLIIFLVYHSPDVSPPPPSVDIPVPETIWIPTGTFKMGTSEQERQQLLTDYPDFKWDIEDDKPSEKELSEFWIGKFEVTNQQYKAFLKERPGRGDIERLEPPDYPVADVSWYDAVNYCDWLSRVTGENWSLPTEAQWEKAARGDREESRFPWGEFPDNSMANYGHGSQPKSLIQAVGSFPKGPNGVMDIAGNVAEWCRDDRSDGKKPVRGGSWRDGSFYLRCAARKLRLPTTEKNDTGFRVVKNPR